MPFQSETIKTILDRLNVQYFLPAFQRDYVWKPEQIILLFDSVMQGYPISSFLFWELHLDNKDKWEIYKFQDQAKYPEYPMSKHNEKAFGEGVQQLTLVLDGQQRLSSFLIGLKGAYEIKKKHARANNLDAWQTKRLYLDLFKHPRVDDDDEERRSKTDYAFEFFAQEPRNDVDHHWFRVGRILDCDNLDRFFELRREEEERFPEDVSKEQENTLERNLQRLYDAVWRDANISYYVEREQDYDRVLVIFVRANEAGTELTRAQVLLAMLVSKWTRYQAKDEINGFIDHINNEMEQRNSIDLTFVMRACLVLSDLPVRYKVNNFTNENLSKIEENWQDVKNAIERGIRLVNSFGVNRDNFSGWMAVIPIIHYLHQRPGLSLGGLTCSEVFNRIRIRRWLTMVILNRVFGKASEQILANMRRVLNEHSDQMDFPFNALNDELIRMRRTAYFDADAIKRFLDHTYGTGNTFFALTLLYDDVPWGATPHHKDHIFPQNLFTEEHMTEVGLGAEQQARYLSLMHRIGNLELLTEQESLVKGAKPFEEWLSSRHASFREKHLIPGDDSFLKFERFEEFVEAREALIVQRLKAVISPEGST